MHNTPWLVRQTAAQARLRLYCFSYAGGNAGNFAPWQAALDPAIEVCAVQLPGRGGRFGEAPYTSLSALVEALAQVISHQDKLPFAFFGHSLGGLLGFEVARFCQRHFLPMPKHLIVSGCAAPRLRKTERQLHLLDDEALIEELKTYNGTPPAVLASRELMALLLPMIRADFSMVETYQYRVAPLLELPITVLAGTGDDHVSQEQVDGWKSETTHACHSLWFEGDHFFLHPQRAAVLARVDDVLRELTLVSR
ncbi:MAG: alpha/beta fold hydrolase [Pseudomonadota bacterium]